MNNLEKKQSIEKVENYLSLLPTLKIGSEKFAEVTRAIATISYNLYLSENIHLYRLPNHNDGRIRYAVSPSYFSNTYSEAQILAKSIGGRKCRFSAHLCDFEFTGSKNEIITKIKNLKK